jgi:hypothetical protein
MSENRVGVIMLWLRIEHVQYRARILQRAYKRIERQVLTPHGARRIATGEHRLTLSYQTDNDLDDLIDDLLFEISGMAQMMDCYSETEARLDGTDRRW